MAYEDVLNSLGEFGRYQKRIYFLLCLPAISCALHKLVGVFLQARVNHRCRLTSEFSNSSYFLEDDLMNKFYPRDSSNTYSSCSYFDLGSSEDTGSNGFSNKSLHCSKWIYDLSTYHSTTVSEWDLVCDRSWLRATSDSLLMIGVMLGSIIFGDLSDRVGRRPIFFLSLVMQVVFGVIVGLAPNISIFMISRLIVGATTSGVFLVAYVIALEMVGPKMRMFAGVTFQIFFATGFILTAGFAYFIRNWRILQIAVTVPGIAFLSYWWFIPESVRWLLTRERYDEAKKILLNAGKENKREIPQNQLDSLFCSTEDKQKSDETSKPSLLDLMKHSNLRKKSLAIFFLWLVNSGAYYGLSWNTSNLGGDEYLNFVISGCVEIPAYIFLLLTLNRLGRKLILCGSMITAGICLILTVFVPENLNWINITLAMAGKLAISSSYATVYIFSAEQFPTVIRNVGIGAASTFARVGGILAPYVNIMAEIWKPLPLLVFGILALLAGLCATILPETMGKTLPDTILEGENFGKKDVTAPSADGEQLETFQNKHLEND